MIKRFAKSIVNACFARLGARVVSEHWGPRGFVPILSEIKSAGVALDQVIDVGASDGSWTKECQEALPNAKYFLIDPLPGNVSKLENFRAKNNKVDFLSCAVGATPGNCMLYHHGDQSSFLPGVFSSSPNDQISVPMYTLDDLYQKGKFARPDFIKLDVQGHELQVFEGATECLSMAKIIQVETHIQPSYDGAPYAHEIIQALAKFDFRIFDLCSYVQRPMDSRLANMDIMFAKPIPELFRFGWN